MIVGAGPSPFTETSTSTRRAAFAELAASGPVQQTVLFTGVRVWLITGHAEARELLTHPHVTKPHHDGAHLDEVPAELGAARDTHMLMKNPPDHTRLRRLVSAFTRRRVDTLAPRIQAITDALLDDVEATGADGTPVDLVAAFGYPLPIAVIAEMVGVPADIRDEFRTSTPLSTSSRMSAN